MGRVDWEAERAQCSLARARTVRRPALAKALRIQTEGILRKILREYNQAASRRSLPNPARACSSQPIRITRDKEMIPNLIQWHPLDQVAQPYPETPSKTEATTSLFKSGRSPEAATVPSQT